MFVFWWPNLNTDDCAQSTFRLPLSLQVSCPLALSLFFQASEIVSLRFPFDVHRGGCAILRSKRLPSATNALTIDGATAAGGRC